MDQFSIPSALVPWGEWSQRFSNDLPQRDAKPRQRPPVGGQERTGPPRESAKDGRCDRRDSEPRARPVAPTSYGQNRNTSSV